LTKGSAKAKHKTFIGVGITGYECHRQSCNNELTLSKDEMNQLRKLVQWPSELINIQFNYMETIQFGRVIQVYQNGLGWEPSPTTGTTDYGTTSFLREG
jgi:hypothetical protein